MPGGDGRSVTPRCGTVPLLTAGCGAGFGATTNSISSSGVGVASYENRIRILNALVFPPVPRLRPEATASSRTASPRSRWSRV